MNGYERIIAERTRIRLHTAETASRRVIDGLRAEGIDIRVFGSLARGEFRVHSDIDFLVRGSVTSRIRVAVERTVAHELGNTDIPYDIIYLDDLAPDQAAVFDRV